VPREKKPPEPPEDVPKWFMTYSDVITLLMTFFILLLTFATTEPERFEKMKISMFGGNGSSGIVSDMVDGIDRDSLVMRTRNESARQAERGTEMPPVDKDAPDSAMDKGLSGLESNVPQIEVNSVNLTLPVGQLASLNGEVFEYGEKTLGMLAKLSRQRQLDIRFETSNKQNLPRIMALVEYLIQADLIEAGNIAVEHNPAMEISSKNIRAVLQFVDGVKHASRPKETAQ